MSDTTAAFAELGKKTYKNQAIWMLNGFWNEFGRDNAEMFWDLVKKFAALDDKKGADGNELDEFNSHRLLEAYDETLTAIKMREALREIDQDANGQMSLVEYAAWRFKKSPAEVLASPQGDNTAAIERCEAVLAEVQSALADVTAKAEANARKQEEQTAAIAAQRDAIAATEAAIAELAQKEQELVAAEAEAKAAVAELKAQEDAYNAKIAELEAKSTDTSIGIVTRNKAANELSQLKGEDPLPLRKAKITQEAAVRLVQKAQAATAAAKADTEAKKVEQEEAEAALREVQAQLEAAGRELEAAQVELEGKMAEAAAELERVKAEGGESHGNLFFMGRALYEADESLPRAKQKYDHSKPFPYEG